MNKALLVLLAPLLAAHLGVSLAGGASPVGASLLTDEAFLSARFLSDPIPADERASSLLRVELIRVGGTASDDGIVITVSRADDSAAICAIGGGASAQRSTTHGSVTFDVASLGVTGTCHVTATAITAVAAEAQLTLRAAGTPTRLTVSGNNSPQAVGTPITVGVDIDDVYVNLVGDDRSAVTIAFDGATCTGSPGGDVYAESTTVTASGGRAWFTIRSTGVYGLCSASFAAPGVRSATTTFAFDRGPADHLVCGFSPTALNAGGDIANLSAELRDLYGNPVDGGTSGYAVSVTRVAGVSTTLISDAQRPMLLGAAFFAVTASAIPGLDEYLVSIAADSPTTLAVPQARCAIPVRAP